MGPLSVLLVVSILGAGPAQTLPFRDGLESADTSAWSAGAPPTSCRDLPTFEIGIEATLELHVATTGSDETGDGSSGSPFATIEHAASLAVPGTAIRVHAGTYAGDGFVNGLQGTSSAPIWIGGVEGEARPVLQGGDSALQLVQASWVVLHDLEVTGATANGINCDDGDDRSNPLASHHLVFRRLWIHDIGSGGNQDCLKLSGINHFAVLDSVIERCGAGGSGIDLVGCHDSVIARNDFRDTGSNAVQAKGGSENVEIRWNHFVDAGPRAVNAGGSTGFEFFRPPLSETTINAEARSIRVIANIFEGSDAPVAYVGCVDCVVAANTIIDPTRWVLRILQETTSDPPYEFAPSSGGVFANNLVYYDLSALSTWVNIGPDTEPASFAFAHNLWFAHDDPPESTPDLPSLESGGIYGEDPQLDGNLHFDMASPAFEAGTHASYLKGDHSGRCYRAPPSIGAFEVR